MVLQEDLLARGHPSAARRLPDRRARSAAARAAGAAGFLLRRRVPDPGRPAQPRGRRSLRQGDQRRPARRQAHADDHPRPSPRARCGPPRVSSRSSIARASRGRPPMSRTVRALLERTGAMEHARAVARGLAGAALLRVRPVLRESSATAATSASSAASLPGCSSARIELVNGAMNHTILLYGATGYSGRMIAGEPTNEMRRIGRRRPADPRRAQRPRARRPRPRARRRLPHLPADHPG